MRSVFIFIITCYRLFSLQPFYSGIYCEHRTDRAPISIASIFYTILSLSLPVSLVRSFVFASLVYIGNEHTQQTALCSLIQYRIGDTHIYGTDLRGFYWYWNVAYRSVWMRNAIESHVPWNRREQALVRTTQFSNLCIFVLVYFFFGHIYRVISIDAKTMIKALPHKSVNWTKFRFRIKLLNGLIYVCGCNELCVRWISTGKAFILC